MCKPEGSNLLNSLPSTTISPSASQVDAIVASATQQESDAERIQLVLTQELLSHIIRPEDEYPDEEFLLSIKGVGAFAKKDIISIKAKQKEGKTTMISILIAVLLGGQWNKLKREINHIPRIIYFDNEMKERDTWQMYRKSLQLAHLPNRSVDDVLFVNLRKLSYQQCAEIIEKYVAFYRPDIIFVDGIVDLICDFNNIEQSQALVRSHMNLAEEYDCCIVEVLHTNKAADDHNMRGHLGTILSQKGSNTFECKKDKKLNVVTVSCDDYRKQPVPEWSFGFDANGIPVCADDAKAKSDAEKQAAKDRKNAEKQEKAKQTQLQAFRDILAPTGDVGMPRKRLVDLLVPKLGLKESAVYDIVKKFIDDGTLLCNGYNGGITLNENRE